MMRRLTERRCIAAARNVLAESDRAHQSLRRPRQREQERNS